MADPFGNIPLNVPGAQATPTSSPPTAASPMPAAPIPTPIAPRPEPIRASIPAPILEPIRPDVTPITKRMPRHTGTGPIIGAVIIVILFIFGGLYFWGAHLNAQEKAPLPLISGDPAQQ